MVTNSDNELMNAKYDRIRDVLHSQCSEEDFRLLKCPQCGGKLTLQLNHDGMRFFVKCVDDSTHLAMHGKNETPPKWFEQVPKSGWYGTETV
jgi:hypothetical protein